MHKFGQIGTSNFMIQYLLEPVERNIFLPLHTFNATVKNHFMRQQSSFHHGNWTYFVIGRLCMNEYSDTAHNGCTF